MMIIVEMRRTTRVNIEHLPQIVCVARGREIKPLTHASARISRFPPFCLPFFSLSTQD